MNQIETMCDAFRVLSELGAEDASIGCDTIKGGAGMVGREGGGFYAVARCRFKGRTITTLVRLNETHQANSAPLEEMVQAGQDLAALVKGLSDEADAQA